MNLLPDTWKGPATPIMQLGTKHGGTQHTARNVIQWDWMCWHYHDYILQCAPTCSGGNLLLAILMLFNSSLSAAADRTGLLAGLTTIGLAIGLVGLSKGESSSEASICVPNNTCTNMIKRVAVSTGESSTIFSLKHTDRRQLFREPRGRFIKLGPGAE